MHDVGERRIGREPERDLAAAVANVVGALDLGRARLAVVEGRADADFHARKPDWLDAADDLRGVEHALEAGVAGREVDDAHAVSGIVLDHGFDDGGVAQVGRVGPHRALDEDICEPLLLVPCEHAREDGIAVEAREAPPHDARRAIEQGGNATVADDRVVERLRSLRMGDHRHLMMRLRRHIHAVIRSPSEFASGAGARLARPKSD